VDGNCPDCGRPVELTREPAYFFRLSKYADRLIALFEGTPEFLQPDARRNEMLSFIKQGLDDLCISRSSFDWGIPVPIEEGQVIYVWLDALSNYITALGWPEELEKYDKYWPADVHLVGKEIVRFHTIIWPAMLMSMDVPLPKKVLSHGWLLLEGGKMSKSRGNVVDPVKLIERYGVDALKYFLLREYSFGQDGLYTNEVMLNRINADLANDLGNLVSRTAGMIEQYSGGTVPAPSPASGAAADLDKNLADTATSAAAKVEDCMDRFVFNRAMEEIWNVVSRTNKYIDETAPWVLAKNDADKARLDTVLYNLAESLRIISVLITPFMHTTAEEIRRRLGIEDEPALWGDASRFGKLGRTKVEKGAPLFPRIDVNKELEILESL
jgi:methionyl-tRNA synthetase